eukprot:gene625-8129_t
MSFRLKEEEVFLSNRKLKRNLVKNGYNLKREQQTDKRVLLKVAKLCSDLFENVPEKIMLDKKFLLELIQINPKIIKYVPKEIYNDREIMFLAVKKRSKSYLLLSEELKKDKEFVVETLRKQVKYFKNVPIEVFQDEKFVLKVLKESEDSFDYFMQLKDVLKPNMFEKKEFMFQILDICPSNAFEYLENYQDVFGDSEKILNRLMTIDCSCFMLSSKRLKASKEFVVEILNFLNTTSPYLNRKFFLEISEELRNDIDVVSKFIKKSDNIFRDLIPKELQQNDVIGKIAVQNNFKFRHLVNPNIYKDEKFLLELISNYRFNVDFSVDLIPNELQNEDFYTKLIIKVPDSLLHLPENGITKSFLMKLVSKCDILSYIPDIFKNDIELEMSSKKYFKTPRNIQTQNINFKFKK